MMRRHALELQRLTHSDLLEEQHNEAAAVQSIRPFALGTPEKLRGIMATVQTFASCRNGWALLRPISIAFGLTFVASLSTAQVHARSFGKTVFDTQWNQRTYVAIGAGDTTTLAIDSNGACIGSGNNDDGECFAPTLQGFSLHAQVLVPAGQRERLEHLCR